MERRAVSVRFAVVLVCLIGSACSRPSTSDREGEIAPAVDESARSAQAQRSRSSASQTKAFTPEERARFTRVEQMIQAHFAGVQVTTVGGSYSIRIRGNNSLTSSSNEPLMLIDGVSRAIGELSGLNPRDVVSIEVVKDAAAFYGVRGANGVIIITTRKSS